MKKLSLLILAMSIIFVSYADSITIKVPDTAKLTVGKVYKDVKAGLMGLAQALKVPAEHVYSVIVKQQIVKAVTFLIVFVLSIFLIINWMIACKSTEKWDSTDGPTGLGIIRIFQIAAGLIMFAISIFYINNIVTGFTNPEYGALKDIVNFIK